MSASLSLATGVLAGVLLWPQARALAGLEPFGAEDLTLCIAAIVGFFLLLEAAKAVQTRRRAP